MRPKIPYSSVDLFGSFYFILKKRKRFFRNIAMSDGISRMNQFLRILGVSEIATKFTETTSLPMVISSYDTISKSFHKKYSNFVISFKKMSKTFNRRNFLDEYLDIVMSNNIEYANLQIIFKYHKTRDQPGDRR